MKQQDKLKKTLREYYDNQQVPFSDNEWERASAYLEEARRERKKRSALLILLLLVSGSLLLLVSFPKPTSKKQVHASLPIQAQENSLPSSQSEVAPAYKARETKFKKTSGSVSSKKTEPSASALSVAERHTRVLQVLADIPQKKSQKLLSSEVVSLVSDSVKQTHTKEEVVSNNPEQVHLAATISGVSDTSNTNESENKEGRTIAKENVESRPVKPEDPAQEQGLSPLKDASQILASTLSPTIESDDTTKTRAPDTTQAAAAAQKIPGVPDVLSPMYPDSMYTDIENMKLDSLSESPTNNSTLNDGVFYEAGAAWLYGWRGDEKRDAKGFCPVLGINYINRLSKRCTFSFGVQYLQVRNLSNSSKISRVSSYAYGEQSSVTVITPSTLHYLLAPLRFHYFVDHKNSFGAGINLAYLLNVDATVTTYDEKPGFNSNYKTIKQGGYTEGFSWFDSQLAFSYRRRLVNSLALQVEMFIGLTDVKQDEFFGFRQKERISGAKLSLIYYAFRKTDRK